MIRITLVLSTLMLAIACCGQSLKPVDAVYAASKTHSLKVVSPFDLSSSRNIDVPQEMKDYTTLDIRKM